MKGRGHLIDLGIDRWIILKCMLRKRDGKSCTEFIWLRTGTSGGLLWVWNCYIQALDLNSVVDILGVAIRNGHFVFHGLS
jgi:hypothetical protein